MEYKSFAIEELKADDDNGTFEGYGSMFGNVDGGKDVVLPGAFAKSLAKARKPKMLWQHKTDLPIGVYDEVREDARGLFVKGRLLLDTDLGRNAYALLKAGAIDGLSIGYGVSDYAIDKKTGTRLLKELELFEVSLVTFPMNEKATITGVKSSPQTLREFENFLREEGKFSQRDATTVALRGFKALSEQGEPDTGELIATLTRTTHMLKGITA